MNKRVHQIAKERGLPSKDVLKRLRAAGRTRRLSPAGCRIQAHGDQARYRQLLFDNGYIA